MPMRPFGWWFPEIDAAEVRVAAVTNHPGLPKGRYAFIELYCDEKGCDCSNVMINVVDQEGRRVATLNHNFDPERAADLGLHRTLLDPLNIQTENSEAILDLFKRVVLDEAYETRLKGHMAMVKRAVKGGRRPRRPDKTLVGRNAPCPCGSGRKYKSCCERQRGAGAESTVPIARPPLR